VVTASVVAQLAIFHTPALQDLFAIGTISAADTLRCIAAGLVPVTAIEVSKLCSAGLARRRARRAHARSCATSTGHGG
jgi:hypothetical protein